MNNGALSSKISGIMNVNSFWMLEFKYLALSNLSSDQERIYFMQIRRETCDFTIKECLVLYFLL